MYLSKIAPSLLRDQAFWSHVIMKIYPQHCLCAAAGKLQVCFTGEETEDCHSLVSVEIMHFRVLGLNYKDSLGLNQVWPRLRLQLWTKENIDFPKFEIVAKQEKWLTVVTMKLGSQRFILLLPWFTLVLKL
jgi:hypothetical protein